MDIVPQTVVGEFHARRRANFVEPYDRRIREWIEIPPGWEKPRRAASKDRIGTVSTRAARAEDLDGLIVHVELVEPRLVVRASTLRKRKRTGRAK